MTAAIPTTEPSAVTAGDTVTWTKTLDDYPASASWVLSYALRNATDQVDITASASGADHLVSVAASITRAWAPGTYAWAAFVTKAAERYEVGRGSIVVRANLAQTAPIDGRTQAAKAVDDLKAALATFKATSGRVKRYRIADREIEFESLTEMMKLLQLWQRELQNEEAAARITAGEPSSLKLQFRF